MNIDSVIGYLDVAWSHVVKHPMRKSERDDIWDLRVNWEMRKRELMTALRDETYIFSPCHAVEYLPGEYLHAYRTQDKLVLKALALALLAILPRSRLCFSYKGHGGVAGALRFIRSLPATKFGFKTDVADYYATIDAARVMMKLAPYVQDGGVSRLIYRALQRGDGGSGLPRGSALSHVLGNFYLHELDCVFEGRPTQHYCRYMDDVLILTDCRGALRRARRTVLAHFACHDMRVAHNKTFIGRAWSHWRGGVFLGGEISLAAGVLVCLFVNLFACAFAPASVYSPALA